MQLKSIEIKNFRSHRHTKIGDLERINYFLGLNGAGKSSIVDAIGYALCGICRGTDEGGRGADLLLTEGQDDSQFVINLELTSGNVMRSGPGAGPKSAAQQTINRTLKLSPMVSRALVDIPHFFLADTAGQKTILEQVLGLEVRTDLIKSACKTEDWEVVKKTVPMPIETYGDLIAAEKALRAVRTGVKASAPVLPPKPDRTSLMPEMSTLTLGEAKITLGQVRAKLRGLYEEKGRQDAIADVAADKRTKAIEEIARQTKSLATLTAELDRIGDLNPAIQATIKDIARLSEEVGAVTPGGSPAASSGAEGFITLLEAADNACPVCTREMSAKARRAAIEKHRAVLEQLDRQPGLMTGKSKREELMAAEARFASLELQDDKATAFRADIKRISAHILNLKTQAASTVVEQSPGPTPEVLARIAKGEGVAAQLQGLVLELETHEKAMAAQTAHQTYLESLERLVHVFGPNGIRLQLIDQKVKAFLEQAKAFGLTLRIDLEPFMVYVGGRRVVMLSQTERLRAGLALQIGMAKVAGLKFVVVDQVDALDPLCRAMLEETMEQNADIQFLLFGSLRTPPDRTPWAQMAAIPGPRAFFHVSKTGEVSAVERKR